MQLPNSLLLLPTAVILLCASPVVAEKPWPHNLPKHMKYFPEDEMHVKRGLSIQDRLQREKPIGVKKMSSDEGEMFLFDNWIFAGEEAAAVASEESTKRSELEAFGNNTFAPAFSPLRPHTERTLFDPLRRFLPRDSQMKRDFQCPEGTNDCSSIGAPDSCCGTSSTCITVQDTGFGTVGCCPEGANCAGSIFCDTNNGYTSCPDSSNGGCCLPGYNCSGVGCVIAGTSITYVQPSTSAPRSSSASSARSSSTAVVVVPTTPSPTLSSTSIYTCSSGWHTCAGSLGGGCCQNGRECATGASCIGSDSSSSSGVAPSAPVRPTSNSITTSENPTSTDTLASLCPTGFYVCSAYYPNGCCRIGRDCQTTGTCVPTSSGAVVVSNGVTIVAPSGASFATTAPPQGGSCPSSWYSCAANLGGNCCPNGYSCGEQCTATAGGNVAGKVAPSTGNSFSSTSIWILISGGVGIGIGMIIL